MRTVDPVRHEGKRQEILAAAMKCFVRDGFRGASIAEICAESKISPGHLYHYFPSKEAIVADMGRAYLGAATAHFSRLMEGPDALAAMLALIDQSRERQHRGALTFLLDMLAEAGRNSALAKILQEHSRLARGLLADFLGQLQSRGQVDSSLDPEVTAGILMGIVDGARIMAVRDPKLDMTKTIAHLRLLIVRFLMALQPSP